METRVPSAMKWVITVFAVLGMLFAGVLTLGMGFIFIAPLFVLAIPTFAGVARARHKGQDSGSDEVIDAARPLNESPAETIRRRLAEHDAALRAQRLS